MNPFQHATLARMKNGKAVVIIACTGSKSCFVRYVNKEAIFSIKVKGLQKF